MTACVVCLRPAMRNGICCKDCHGEYIRASLPHPGDVIAWAAKRAREFAYEDAARALEATAARFDEQAQRSEFDGHQVGRYEFSAEVLRELALAIRAKAGK